MFERLFKWLKNEPIVEDLVIARNSPVGEFYDYITVTILKEIPIGGKDIPYQFSRGVMVVPKEYVGRVVHIYDELPFITKMILGKRGNINES